MLLALMVDATRYPVPLEPVEPKQPNAKVSKGGRRRRKRESTGSKQSSKQDRTPAVRSTGLSQSLHPTRGEVSFIA
jgi:hypothetical protein